MKTPFMLPCRRWWLMAVVIIEVALILESAMSDPEINLLNKGCSQYNATNLSDFFSNLNATFSGLRNQISSQNKKFATAQQARTSDPVYAMVQCRDYLSVADCVSCLDAAVSQIRNCSAANGARVIYDGCFLRLGLHIHFSHLINFSSLHSLQSMCQIPSFLIIEQGTLKNGNIIAVKKLALSSSRAKADFESEVKLISNVHHRNLIRLLGCSNKGPELLLVYEYMANGSLDRFLYGERRGALNWKQRFEIIFGTARGLAYLHEQFHVCIIHRDIKSSNILLDDDFQPKIADFGLARLLPEDQSHLSTRFAGTLGYTAPEYAIHGQLSEKVDTYSFGVVVLEIISGRKCNEMKVESTEFLLEQAWKLYEDDMHLKLVDDSMNEYREEEVKKVIEIALMCTQSPVSVRPTMSEVVVLLVSERSIELTRPTRPTLIDNDKKIREEATAATGPSTSDATASFTEFTGR
ncbi:cysteine-rich receptor-like protein kinase 2 [Camellia sinensis]|uniref:cysteine-rich receptor-like protein kinase 2 n=1 Tax=Camellia sinensis TaxID=4442 RepID=UPI001035C697|nr:cysteine-rich receptor-like protein kinase 2 [Camellia sinensis]